MIRLVVKFGIQLAERIEIVRTVGWGYGFSSDWGNANLQCSSKNHPDASLQVLAGWLPISLLISLVMKDNVIQLANALDFAIRTGSKLGDSHWVGAERKWGRRNANVRQFHCCNPGKWRRVRCRSSDRHSGCRQRASACGWKGLSLETFQWAPSLQRELTLSDSGALDAALSLVFHSQSRFRTVSHVARQTHKSAHSLAGF